MAEIIKIKVGYGQTVFEAPFQPKVFSIELEIIPKDRESTTIVKLVENLQEVVYKHIQEAIEKYAPNARTFDDLQRMQKGQAPLGKTKKEDDDSFNL